MVIGALVVIFGYGVSFYAFSIGYAVEAASMVVGSVLANLASVFVARKRSTMDEKKESKSPIN